MNAPRSPALPASGAEAPAGWRQRYARPLNGVRLLVLAIGVPTLVWWAAGEQAPAWQHGWSFALVGGIVLSQIAIVVYALRFRTSMRVVGIHLSLIETLRINTLSLFYQFFVPLSLGADLTKLIKLKTRSHTSLASVSGIVLDHFIGLLALVMLSLGLLVWRRPLELDIDLGMLVAVTVVLMIAAGFAAIYFFRRRRFHVAELFVLMRRARFEIALAMLLAVVMQTLLASAVFTGSLAWGLDVAYLDVLFVMTTALIFQAVPVNLAGLGLTEVAGTGLYVALGLPLSGAVLLVSLLYGYRLLGAIIGGLWDLLPDSTAAS